MGVIPKLIFSHSQSPLKNFPLLKLVTYVHWLVGELISFFNIPTHLRKNIYTLIHLIVEIYYFWYILLGDIN